MAKIMRRLKAGPSVVALLVLTWGSYGLAQPRFGNFGGQGHTPPGHGGGHHPPNLPINPHGPNYPHVPVGPIVPPVTPHVVPTPIHPTPYVPNYVPDYAPQVMPNPIIPDITPETNVVPVDVTPEPNHPWEHVTPVTPEQIEDWKHQTDHQTQQIIDELSKIIDGKIPDVIHNIHDHTDHGTLTPEHLIDLIHHLEPLVPHDPGKQTHISGLINRLVINNRLKFVLINVNIVININAWWNFGVIIWVPALPWGQVILLNNGWWFAGMGFCCGNDIWFDTGYLPQAAGLPYAIGPPVPESQLERVASGVLLANGTTATVNYTVDGQPFTMPPNYRQALPAGRSWTVAFDRGGGFGTATYSLTDGTYKFAATQRGLDLFRHQFQVTVDNRDNPFVFRYVVDNARQTLAAKQSQIHSGNYPIEVRFDDGAGQSKRKVLETGTFRVAVGKDNKLDLFAPDAVRLPTPLPELTKQRKPATINLFADPKKLTPDLFATRLPELPGQAPSGGTAEPVAPNPTQGEKNEKQ